MYIKNYIVKILFVFSTLVLVCCLYTKNVSAIWVDSDDDDDESYLLSDIKENNFLIYEKYNNNAIIFGTYEKRATSNIRYLTLGFKATKVNLGNSLEQTKNTKFSMDQSEINVIVDSENSAYCYSVFPVNKKTLLNQYIGIRDKEWAKELNIIGGTIQLDAIMTYAIGNRIYGSINEDGQGDVISYGKVYDTFIGISKAQNWSSTKGLSARYNIRLELSPIKKDVEYSYEYITQNKLSIDSTGNSSATVTTTLESTTHQFTPQISIPTGELVTLTTKASNLQGTVNYQNVSGAKIYPVKVNLTGQYQGHSIQTSKTVYISRPYSYNKITSVDLYQPDKISIENAALSDRTIEISSLGNSTYSAYQYSNNILSSNPQSDITYTADVNIGYITDLSQVDQRIESALSYSFPNIIVRNDLLIVNGILIFDNNSAVNHASNPKSLSDAAATETVTSIITLTDDLQNITYNSNSTAMYKKLYNNEQKKAVTVQGNTNITIHTPVVSTVTIDAEKVEGSYVLEKGDEYTVSFQMAQHIATRGYGFDSFNKYTYARFVQFPIPTLIDDIFVPPNTWTLVNQSFKLRLPNEVMEKNVTLKCKSIATNFKSVNGGSNTISNEMLSSEVFTQAIANLDRSNYIASYNLDFKVVTDKIEQFNIYDINDYPFWKTIFRQPDSLKLTDNIYLPGVNKEHTNEKLTLPLLNGSHLTASNKGALKLGYTFRYNVTTTGNMYGENDYISIIPKFYYVDKNGNNRQEVDLYYTETIENTVHRLVCIGSDIDQGNIHSICLGNSYHSIEDSVFATTGGIDGITPYDLKFAEMPAYSYGNIKLNSRLRTLTGTSKIPEIPLTNELIRNTQTWYGEYRLPSETYAVPKGYKLDITNIRNGFTGTEDFWLNDGYIIINFTITGYQYDIATDSHTEFLPYYNPTKNINVWKKEGYQLLKKDSSGVEFNLEYGDVAFLYTIYQKNNAGKYYKVNADQDFNPGGSN